MLASPAALGNVPAIYAFQATLQQSVILAPVLAGIAAVETASFPGWEPTDFKMKAGIVPGSYANVEGASPWTKDKLGGGVPAQGGRRAQQRPPRHARLRRRLGPGALHPRAGHVLVPRAHGHDAARGLR